MADQKYNIPSIYVDLIKKIKKIEGVDIEYIDKLVALLYQDINLIDIDVKNIKDLIPDDATTANQLATESDIPPAQVNADWNANSGVAQILNKPTIPAAQVNADWNASSGVAEILNKPTIPAAQVNADWNASSGVAEILNKPTIPAAQVNADWNANSGVAQILNKPTIPTSSFQTEEIIMNNWYGPDLEHNLYYREILFNNCKIDDTKQWTINLYPLTSGAIAPTAAEVAAYNCLVGCEVVQSGTTLHLTVYSSTGATGYGIQFNFYKLNS